MSMSQTHFPRPYLLHRPPSSFFTLLTTSHLLYLTNPPSSYLTCVCSLQRHGSTALMMTSECGYTEIVQALLTAPGIDTNHANVSIYSLRPLYSSIFGCGEVCLPLSFPLTFVLMFYHPLISKMYPITSEQYSRPRCVSFHDCICFLMTHNNIFTSDVVVTITPRIHRINR